MSCSGKKNQDVSLEEAIERFKDSHQKIMVEIEKMRKMY